MGVFEFMRPAVGGAVHLFDQVTFNRQVARCGRTGRPDVDSIIGVAEFEHDDLCFQCWAYLPHEHRSALYRHLLGARA